MRRGFYSCVQYILSVKDSEGNMVGNAHASMTYESILILSSYLILYLPYGLLR